MAMNFKKAITTCIFISKFHIFLILSRWFIACTPYWSRVRSWREGVYRLLFNGREFRAIEQIDAVLTEFRGAKNYVPIDPLSRVTLNLYVLSTAQHGACCTIKLLFRSAGRYPTTFSCSFLHLHPPFFHAIRSRDWIDERKNGACGKEANYRGELDGKEKKKSRERVNIYTYVQRKRREVERKESWRLKSKTDDSRREYESLLFAHQ